MGIRNLQLKLSLLVLTIFTTVAPTALATPVYGTLASFSGSRSIGSGLTGTGAFANANITLSWNITDNGNGTFLYSYTIDGFQGIHGGGISHFTLDLSDNYDLLTITNAMLEGDSLGDRVAFGTFDEPAQSGPYQISGGVKFDAGSDFALENEASLSDGLTYSFISNRVPVWSLAFIKGGGGLRPGNHAFTSGFLDLNSDETALFVAAPDSVTTVPEPTSFMLLGASLLGIRRLKKRM